MQRRDFTHALFAAGLSAPMLNLGAVAHADTNEGPDRGGVQLNVRPTVTDSGRIVLELSPQDMTISRVIATSQPNGSRSLGDDALEFGVNRQFPRTSQDDDGTSRRQIQTNIAQHFQGAVPAGRVRAAGGVMILQMGDGPVPQSKLAAVVDGSGYWDVDRNSRRLRGTSDLGRSLGDIPVFGSLFRHRSASSRRPELIVFITSAIVNPDRL